MHLPSKRSARYPLRPMIGPADAMETDWAIGPVAAALDKHGLAENTVLIFAADNGHCSYTPLKPLLDAGHRPSQRLCGYGGIWEGDHTSRRSTCSTVVARSMRPSFSHRRK